MTNNHSLFPQGIILNIKGKAVSLRGDDIDTDRIIPARFLKCVSFNNLGDQVFSDDRAQMQGLHPFDQESNKGSNILMVNDNFGCGSSREHAPQALIRWGIRGIIGESFAEIFYGNCLALGIPCVITSKNIIKSLQDLADNENEVFDINLKKKLIYLGEISFPFEINSSALEMFTSGRWDATSQLISHKKKIIELKRKIPYLNNFN